MTNCVYDQHVVHRSRRLRCAAGRPARLYPPQKLAQLGPVCHRLDRREQRHERRLRDRVRRGREAVPLAHTRPAEEAGDYEETDVCDSWQGGRGGPLRHGRHRSPRPVRAATNTRGFAVDLLQVQPAETIHSIYDCRLAKPFGATRSRRGSRARWRRVRRYRPQLPPLCLPVLIISPSSVPQERQNPHDHASQRLRDPDWRPTSTST